MKKNNYILKLEKQIEGSFITKDSHRGWITWGKRNDFPTMILDMYNQSPTLASCINFRVNSIVGNGVEIDDTVQYVPNYKYDWNTFCRNISLDYCLYGSFAFQIIKNKDNKTYSIYHQPMETVRSGVKDEDGVVLEYYISSDWSATSKYPPFKIKSFGFQDDEKINIGEPYLYVHSSYNPINEYYSSPIYIQAIDSVLAEIDYQKYDRNTALNNFTPNGIIELNYIEDDEAREATVNDLNKFITADNAGRLFVVFRNNVDDVPVKFTPISQNVNNVNLYESANKRVVNRIVVANRITSKGLIGFPIEDSGFSSEAAILDSSYKLYNIIQGNADRKIIEQSLNNIFKLNGIDIEIKFKPLTFVEETTNEDRNMNTSTTNIEEQITNENNQQQ